MTARSLVFLLIAAAGTPVFAADTAQLPDEGYDTPRYEDLWTKSPFAVASAETAAPESPDYSLVGIAEIGGTPFASLIDKKSQEHFLLAGDEPERGLTLVSVTRGKDTGGTFAVVKRDGQSITLKLEEAPAPPVPPAVATASAGQPPFAPPVNAPPGAPLERQSGQTPPPVTFHHRIVRIPPQPGANPPTGLHSGAIHQFSSPHP